MSESRKAFESHVNQYDTFGDEWQDKGVDEHFISGYEAGKAARAGQESEPFAFCFTDVNGKPSEFCDHPKHAAEGDTRIRTPLYTHPTIRQEGEAIGEVGYMFQPNWDDPGRTRRVALVDKSLDPGTKLYTHPASAEVERLQARVAELESDEQEMAGDNNV